MLQLVTSHSITLSQNEPRLSIDICYIDIYLRSICASYWAQAQYVLYSLSTGPIRPSNFICLSGHYSICLIGLLLSYMELCLHNSVHYKGLDRDSFWSPAVVYTTTTKQLRAGRGAFMGVLRPSAPPTLLALTAICLERLLLPFRKFGRSLSSSELTMSRSAKSAT